VSKQVDAVFKKLEVHSRAELAARFGPATKK
jgi:DNA-binding NarL/FixJ family response regulator